MILRTYKLGEADRIVVFLTRDRGKKRGVAKGARRARSRYIGALEPMTRAGVAYYEREQRDLVRLNYVEITRSPLSAASGEALGHVGYFAELIDEWAPEAHVDERLYRLGIVDGGRDRGGRAGGTAGAVFRVLVVAAAGSVSVDPAMSRLRLGLSDGAAMPANDAVLLCRACAPGTAGTRLSPEAMVFLNSATTVGPDAVGTLMLGAHAARELEAAHRRLITVHLDKDLKSARVLREMRQAR